MYHYTPAFATEFGTDEFNGWRAMRATAIDNCEYGIRRMMKEHPEYAREQAEEIFDAKELVRRMELGSK